MNLLSTIDRLAGRWLDWRMDRAARTKPEFGEFGLKRLDATMDGWEIVATYPAVAIIADEMAGFLNAYKADNYVQFDMMPRLDRGLRPVRVTVSWARGEMPSKKAARLEGELKAAHDALNFDRHYPEDVFTPLSEDELDSLVDVIHSVVRNGSDRLHADWARRLAKAARADCKRRLSEPEQEGIRS